MPGSLSTAVAGSVHHDLVSVVSEAIEGALGEDRIVKEGRPFVDRSVRSNDGRGAFMPFDDDFVEVAGLLGRQSAEAEVVDDQEIGRQQGT